MTLSIENVVKRFGAVTAVDGVSLEIGAEEFVCFLGPSGCGKTTLLRVIAGLEEADSGRVLLDGADLSDTPVRSRNFGVVFQSYSLFPNMTTARNVAYGLECRRWPRPRIRERVAEMLRLVSLEDQAEKYPAQLSGGQQQRVALARALAPDPALLLLDEPLSALDAKVREGLRLEIRELQRRLGITTIMVTHDQEEALTMADRIVVMRAGVIEHVGTPLELYRKPANRFVAEFIGRMNILPVDRGEGIRVAGQSVNVDVASGSRRPAVLGIRPEDIELRIRSNGEAAANVLPAEVRQTVFLGNIAHVIVSVGDALPPVLAEVRGMEAATFVVGAPVGVGLPAVALRVLEWR
jgi:iron(III) transport system ATP-binding protein